MAASFMAEIRTELLRSWLTKAAHDLKNARIVGAAEEGPLDTAIYHCQQAAEKAVKAFLVHCGITPQKTHDIRKLTLQAAAHQIRSRILMCTPMPLANIGAKLVNFSQPQKNALPRISKSINEAVGTFPAQGENHGSVMFPTAAGLFLLPGGEG
jgi:hypothetical protein